MTTLFSGFVKEHDLEVNSMLSCLVAALFFMKLFFQDSNVKRRFSSEERPTHFLLSRKCLSNRMNPFGRIHNLANNQFALIGQCPDQRSNKKNSREVPRDGWLHWLENEIWESTQKQPPEFEDNPIFKYHKTISSDHYFYIQSCFGVDISRYLGGIKDEIRRYPHARRFVCSRRRRVEWLKLHRSISTGRSRKARATGANCLFFFIFQGFSLKLVLLNYTT